MENTMNTEIFKNYQEFIARPDSTVNGVSPEFAAAHPDSLEEYANESCWNCHDCHSCVDCHDCHDCTDCHYCHDCIKSVSIEA
jgi:hypothetical protein